MERQSSEKWFDTNPSTNPALVQSVARIQQFVDEQLAQSRRLALVTSGGTTVPLESRTVRYIDNFSVGNRGAISAEYFLEAGYAVLFLHRRGSLEPYARHLQHVNVLDRLVLQDDRIIVSSDKDATLKDVLARYKTVQAAGTLLHIEFTTLSDYLHLLQASALALSRCGNSALLYLAAAVSDFYIPAKELPDHKIQSSDGPLELKLHLVPKMLRPLVHDWCPEAFVVSFKLETNPDLLIKKAEQALHKYCHKIVVGNVLETRKKEVVLVTPGDQRWIRLDDSQLKAGMEIEKSLVHELVSRHNTYVASATSK